IWPLVAIAAVAAGTALFFRGRAEAARRREGSALRDNGVDSHLSHVGRQVDGLMEDTGKRRRRTHVAADQRSAAISWTRLAGDVTVEWAPAHQSEIDAAAQLRLQISAMDTTSSSAAEIDETAASVARTVLGQMARLRRIGYGAESFPLLLDDPFIDLAPATRLALLELISRAAGSPQVILLTEADDVAAWARRSEEQTSELQSR